MSDSEDDFLSADEGSDVELSSSKKEVADDITVSSQTQAKPRITNSGDSQANNTSLMDIYDPASLQTELEHTTKSSDASQLKNTLTISSSESEIQHKKDLDDVNTDTNVITDSKLKSGLAEDFDIDSFDNIEESLEMDENIKESKSQAAISKRNDNLDFKHDLPDIENVQETYLNILDKSYEIKTDQNENQPIILDNTSEGKMGFQSNDLSVSDNEVNIKPILTCSNEASIPKPLKKSKIGAKKNKEKLGVKMGAKKLGSKVTKKQESIINDNERIIIETIEEKLNLEDPLQEKLLCFTSEKDILQEVRKEDDCSKQELWEEQESRWREVQGITGAPLKQTSQIEESEESGWGSWGNWSSSLMSAVETLSQEVGRGVGTVIETVEGGLGVPDPETLAKELVASENQIKEASLENNLEQTSEEPHIQNDMSGSSHECSDNEKEIEKLEPLCNESQESFSLTAMTGLGTNSFGGFGFLMSGATKALETASNTVLLGGLDTLELIGQKAMDTIQQGDPGLKKKRALLMEENPNLFETLQEARQCADSKEEQKLINPQRPITPTLYQAWDNTEGPIHLEALFLVAKQCQGKTSKLLQTLPPHSLTKLTNSNAEIRKCCEISDENLPEEERGDFFMLDTIAEGKGLHLQIEKLKKAWENLESTTSLITVTGTGVGQTLECQLYTAMAELLTQIVSMIHKGSEMALITPDVAPQDVVHQFNRLTCLVCGSVETNAENVCSFITAESSSANPAVDKVITNIYLQASEGNNYMQQCMKHLSTIMQYSNTKKFISAL